jgi:iron complex outermembrane receptor protein
MKNIVFTAFIALHSFGFFAQENKDTTQINEVIIQGNRFEIPFSQAARNVQIVTSEEIKQMPVQSVNELLAYVSGVDIRQGGPFGSQADVSMNGGTFEETLVLLDGIKLINSQTAHNMMNLPIPLDAIDHIEILHGSAARKYGINALAGAINIVTKKSNKSFVEANAYTGSSFQKQDSREGSGIYGGGGVRLTGNYGSNKLSQLVSVAKNGYNGQRFNTSSENFKAFYNGEFRFNEKNSLKLLGSYSSDKFGANGFYAAPGDSNAYEIAKTALFSLSSQHKLGRFTLSPRISNRYDEDDYRYVNTTPIFGRSVHYTNALMAEINASVKTKIGDFGLGLESRFGQINSSNIGKHSRNNHGVYAEYRGAYWRKLFVNAGAYVNYNTSYGWQVYPGIDAAFLFNSHWKLSASAGAGQRIPSFTDLYLNQFVNVGNPNLKPENSWQYEGNLQYKVKKIRIEGGYFYRKVSSFIDWIRDSVSNPYTPQNYGNVMTHGLYIRISHKMQINKNQFFAYNLSYNYLQPSYTTSAFIQSKYVLSSLKHQCIAQVAYGVKGFSFQISNRIIQRMKNKAYDVLDIRLNYAIKGFTIYADVTNILAATYNEFGAVPMPSRWFKLGLRYVWKQK